MVRCVIVYPWPSKLPVNGCVLVPMGVKATPLRSRLLTRQ
jgi:hypothetical protein